MLEKRGGVKTDSSEKMDTESKCINRRVERRRQQSKLYKGVRITFDVSHGEK